MSTSIPKPTISHVIYGEPVTPDVTNRPTIQLENAITAVRDAVNATVVSAIHTSADMEAKANQHVVVDNALGPITVSLPKTPKVGDRVYVTAIANPDADHRVTVSNNSNNVMGEARNIEIDVENYTLMLSYTNAALGWRVI